jgi:hypothetical protein
MRIGSRLVSLFSQFTFMHYTYAFVGFIAGSISTILYTNYNKNLMKNTSNNDDNDNNAKQLWA